jgi:hypothetical protein
MIMMMRLPEQHKALFLMHGIFMMRVAFQIICPLPSLLGSFTLSIFAGGASATCC